MSELYEPKEENLGKDCEFWFGIGNDEGKHKLGGLAIGCAFPKADMAGRLSCEGIIDDVCLYLKIGRHPSSLTKEQIDTLRHRVPNASNRDIPPGDII